MRVCAFRRNGRKHNGTGSRLWPRKVLPKRWLADTALFPDPDRHMSVPDPDAEGMCVPEWQMEPGAAVTFDFRIRRGARATDGAGRRRAFSLRLPADGAVGDARPGRTSPPFPEHGMVAGQCLRADWFPDLLAAAESDSRPATGTEA